MRKRSESGQTLLIVVLIMAVALVVGLGIVARSVTSLRTSTNSENSQQALSAAEAGIEKVLKSGASLTGSEQVGTALIKSATLVSSPATSFVFNGGGSVAQDDGADLWLVPHDPSTGDPTYTNTWPKSMGSSNPPTGTLTFYWCATSDTTCAALEIISISKDGAGATATSTRYTYDSNTSHSNNFNNPPNTLSSATCVGPTTVINNVTYKCSGSINSYSGSLMRVVPLYSDTHMAVKGGFNLPDQGKTIQSTGTAGGTERKVIYFQGYPKLPTALFQYVLLVNSSS